MGRGQRRPRSPRAARALRPRQHVTPPPHIDIAIAERQPDRSYQDGVATLADALVLQMFDSHLGEALRFAYTTIQQHHERESRRAQRAAATEGLRAYLASLETNDEQL